MDDLVLDDIAEMKRRLELKKGHLEGVKAGANFAGMKNPRLEETWDLYNRPLYECNKKGKYKSNILKRQPEQDYISEDNIILKNIEKKILKETNS